MTYHTSQLTIGELKRWWGYALGVSVHTGTPLEKMWADTPTTKTFLPAPKIGSHGMTKERFKKIRHVLSFGPHDEASLRADNWAFVRPLITMFNAHRAQVVVRSLS